MFKSHDILCIFTLVTASFVFDEVLKYETKVICKMHLCRIVSQKKPKRLLLFLSCHSWGKLCVPDGNIKGHGDQFKDCILLGTGRRVGRDGELREKKKKKKSQRAANPLFYASNLYVVIWDNILCCWTDHNTGLDSARHRLD